MQTSFALSRKHAACSTSSRSCRRTRSNVSPRAVLEYKAPSSRPAKSELEMLEKHSVVLNHSDHQTAANVSYGLLRSIITSESLGVKPLENAIASARTYSKDPERQVEKAMANVGAMMAEQVEGRVSTEVDPRLAHDADAMVLKARTLLALYGEMGVPASRLLFRLPATWQGVQAARRLEEQGLAVHMALVCSLVQAAAAGQAGASVVNPNLGRIQDWYARHPNVIRDPQGPRQDAGAPSGVDPGLQLLTRTYNYLKVHHPKTRLMVSGVRTREDALALAGCDLLVLPPNVISAMEAMPTAAGYNDGLRGDEVAEDGGLAVKLSPALAMAAAPEKLPDISSQEQFEEGLGLAGRELLAAGLKDLLHDMEALHRLHKSTTGTTTL